MNFVMGCFEENEGGVMMGKSIVSIVKTKEDPGFEEMLWRGLRIEY